jgi:multisubunit Na+/H+ antiporter MnhG subunit
MDSTILTIGLIFIVIAIILMILGFLGKVAWKIGKWLIIIFIILALATWISSYL